MLLTPYRNGCDTYISSEDGAGCYDVPVHGNLQSRLVINYPETFVAAVEAAAKHFWPVEGDGLFQFKRPEDRPGTWTLNWIGL